MRTLLHTVRDIRIATEIEIVGTMSITLTNAIENGLLSVTAYGGTEQNGTPTPTTPVDIVCNNGVLKVSPNLFDDNSSNIVVGKYINNSGVETGSSANFYNSKYMPVLPSTTYTWSADTSVNYVSFMEYDSSKTFIQRTLVGTSGTPAGVSGTFTTGATTYYVLMGSNPSGQNVDVASIQALKFQFELGSAATAYKQYGQVYINGTTETIKVHGKNLSPNTLSGVGYTSTGGISSSNTFVGNLEIINVTPGEKYTVSYGNFPDGISGVFITTWKTDGTFNMRQAISASGELTYTIPAGIGQANFTLYKTGGATIASNSWMQVEKGDTATTYEPYYDGGTATTETLLAIGEYADKQELISGAITRDIGIRVLDGTEQCSYSSNVFAITFADRAKAKEQVYCTHFGYSSESSANAPDLSCVSFFSVNIGFKVNALNGDVAAFKDMLVEQYRRGTPVVVVYRLIDTVEDMVTGQTLTTKTGDNILEISQASITGLGLSAKYYGISSS